MSNWRDCTAWLQNEQIKLNTSSNEACRLFDCALTQLVSWRELEQYGGLEKTLSSMLAADSDFVLGHVLKIGCELIGNSSATNPVNLTKLTQLKQTACLTRHELRHCDAMIELFNGNLTKAADRWEEILIEKPNDLMALKFAHDIYFYTGLHAQMRDSVARVLPVWAARKQQPPPLLNYVYSMYSFGLVQSNFFQEAKSAALTSLAMNREDGWATHTLCHYNEYKCEPDAGIKFLRDTEADWSVCNLLSVHNYWHLCLYHIERNEHDMALQVFDDTLSSRIKQNQTLDFVDMVSLLYRLRLDMTKHDLRERWSMLRNAYRSRFEEHGYLFNDMHVSMLLKDEEASVRRDREKFIESFRAYVATATQGEIDDSDENNNSIATAAANENRELNRKLGPSLFEAVFSFEQGEFDRVVELLYPIKSELIQIGGSNAQRDLYAQMLVQAALRSKSAWHNRIGLALLNEREGLKPGSRLTERIRARFSSKHILHD